MPDMEKVIKGLEVCTSIEDGESCPKECPYYQDVCYGYDQLMRDALALLKEHEEIIQCKDCYYYHKPEYGFTIGDCTYRTAWYQVKENEFCSLAKRKEGR